MELHRDAEAFRLLVESVEDYALYLLEPDGRVATWNPGAERVEGWHADEIVGQHFSVFYDDADGTRSVLETVAREGRHHEAGWHVRRDGGRFWADVTITAVRQEGTLVGFATVTRDFTEGKREADRQRFLAESGAMLSASLDMEPTFTGVAQLAVPSLADWALVDFMRDGVVRRVAVAHKDPALERVVRRLVRLYPQNPRTEPGLHYVVETGRPLLRPHITDQALAEFAQTPERLKLLKELGLTSWMCVPLIARGRVLGALTFVHAESKRVFDESDLAFALEVGRRAGLALDNARLYDEARQALRAREDFLAVASHELRTPLTPLRLQLDALHRTLAESNGDPSPLRRRIEVMRRQVDRLGRLVESLLAVTRGDRFERVQTEPADLVDIVGGVVERMRERAARLGIPVHFSPPRGVHGRFDARTLEIVLEHLIDNALKYGEGEPVHVSVEGVGDTAVVRVLDFGIGIDEEDQERIFEKFERSVSVEHYGGLGLGLFIARELVEAHGGSLEVHSENGRGTVFTVKLPLEGRPRPSAVELGVSP